MTAAGGEAAGPAGGARAEAQRSNAASGAGERPLRVLLINQVFWPDVAATAQHGHDLGRYLVARGDRVTAIASRSIYGQAGGTLPARDSVDGIEIRRVARSLFGKRGILLRAVDFGLFYVAAGWKALWLPRHDVAICFTTPPFISLLGWFLRLVKGTRWVYWVMDLYPDVPVACGVMKQGSLATRFFERVNRFCLGRADRTVVLGRCMRDRVVAKGIPESRLALINVWSDQDEFPAIPRLENAYRREWGIGDRFTVMYSGNFGLGHDVATMCEAARLLAEDDRFRFVFVGGGKKKAEVEAFVARHQLRNASIQPYQPRARLGELISMGDAHLVTVTPGMEGLIVPSKAYGILAASRPLLFVGPPSCEIARVVEEERCGVAVATGDAAGLAEAIRTLAASPAQAREMGERGRRALESRYGLGPACAAWRTLLHQVCERSR